MKGKRMSLDGLTVEQLRELRVRIEAEIARKQSQAKIELRETFRKMAAEAGIDLNEIAGGKPDKTGKRPMKWRDPKTGVEWAGFGRRPFKFDQSRAERIG